MPKLKSALFFLLLAVNSCLPYLKTPPGVQERTLKSDKEQREYLLHVPAGYTGKNPVPLVITIHGFVQWPAHQLWLSGWNSVADEQGFIVAYPSGTQFPKRWNMRGRNGFQFDPAPDVKFFKRLIAELRRNYNIDPNRIYVNGLSMGGMMTNILACEMAGTIAAAGMVSGWYLDPKEGCNPSRAVPVIAFHGTADPIVPYEGSRSFVMDSFVNYGFPNVPEWAQAWSRRNGCTTENKNSASKSVSSLHYGNCRDGADFIFYTIDGGGHAWPGHEPLPEFIAGYTNQEIDATRIIWEFFQAHPRPVAP